MATIDTSIYGQMARPSRIQTPFESQNQLSAVLQGVNQNRAADLAFKNAEAAAAKQNRLSALLAAEYAGPEQRESALLRSGFMDEASKLGTDRRANQKADIDIDTNRQKLATERYTTFKKTLGALESRPDLSKNLVMQAGQELVAAGIIPDSMYQQSLANMPDDPNALRMKLREGVSAQMTPEQMFTVFAPKPEKLDSGQTISFRDTNPNSPTYGQDTGGAPVQRQMTPGEIAGAATARRGQDITARGQNLTDARGRDANMLKAREIEMMGQPSSGGAVLGAPTPKVLPWANQSNPKDANKVKAIEQSRGAKEIEKDIDAVRKEKDAAAMAARFLELNKSTKTGGLTDRMGITRGLQSLSPEYAEMEAITAKLAPAMRVEGSGSTSDFDGKQFERATVGVDKPAKSNENIAKGVMARAQQAEEYADFRQTYLEQNGTLQGADRYWKEYANKNPIFDPSKPGTFELNAKRKPWSEHFKSTPANGGASPKPSPKSGGVVDFNDLGG